MSDELQYPSGDMDGKSNLPNWVTQNNCIGIHQGRSLTQDETQQNGGTTTHKGLHD